MGHLDNICTLAIILLLALLLLHYWIYVVVVTVLYMVFFALVNNRDKLDIGGKSIFVTGCDSGFGLHLARRLAERGFLVFAAVLDDHGDGAKSLASKRNVHVLKVNVTQQKEVDDALEYVQQNVKGLWAVVNNAGMHFPGDIELVTIEQYQRCTDVNFYGMLRVIKTFLPLLRKSKGRIVNMSSVKGRYSWPGDAIYSVTKHSIETMSDSLRMEMIKFGIKVSVIEPGSYGAATALFGPVQLNRLEGEVERMWQASSDDVKCTYGREYFDRVTKRVSLMIKSRKITSTDPVLDCIEDAILSTSPRKRYLVGGSHVLVDKLTILAKLYNFMPEWMSDSVVCYLSGYSTARMT